MKEKDVKKTKKHIQIKGLITQSILSILLILFLIDLINIINIPAESFSNKTLFIGQITVLIITYLLILINKITLYE